MANPQPSGNGEERGLGDAQQAGTPLPGSRPERAAKNDATLSRIIRTKPDARSADGSTDLCRKAF